MESEWGESGPNLPADLNGDGTVNLSDLIILTEYCIGQDQRELPALARRRPKQSFRGEMARCRAGDDLGGTTECSLLVGILDLPEAVTTLQVDQPTGPVGETGGEEDANVEPTL